MKAGAEVDGGPLAFSVVMLLFVLFLGSTIGGPLSGVSVFFSLLFLFDMIQVFWTNERLRQSETFSNDHPVKGETLVYTHYLESGPHLWRSCRLDLEYHFPKVDSKSYVERQTRWLKGKDRSTMTFSCGFRHRGVYSIGLRDFVLRSWSGWLRLRVTVWERMFYVRPRVVVLNSFPFLTSRDGAEITQSFLLQNADPAVFERVDPYREGMPLRGVDFRPLARGLPPVVRVFLPEPWARIKILVDAYRSPQTNPDTDDTALDREDIVVEAAASLARFLVSQEVPVSLMSAGRSLENWSSTTVRDCEEWEIASVHLQFSEVPSLTEVWSRTERNSTEISGVFISPRPDPQLWDFLERAVGMRRLIQVVKGWDEKSIEAWVNRREFLERAGVQTLELHTIEGLVQPGSSHGV